MRNRPGIAAALCGALMSSAAALQAQTGAAAKPAAPSTQPEGEPSATEATPSLDLPVLEHRLDNGLTLLMSPDKTVPTVAIAVYYDVGARNEEPGRSGFAHLFEHMMFQGSKNVDKGEHFQLIMNRGGSVNGTTSHDRTNYYETLPSHELALGLWLEADRMRSLAITQENFENQRQTVMEERRQSYDNRPYRKSMLRINELAYGDYFPYAHSTIGDMEDLQNAPLSAVQEFFDKYYAPNNAVVSLAGYFDPDKAKALVERYFGDIPRHETPEFDVPPPEPQQQQRQDTMMDPLAELPAFHIAYHIPPRRSPDHYPLQLLGIILGDDESSRLYQLLVKQREILTTIHAATDMRRGPDLFSFWAICAKGNQPEQARKLIYAELDKIAKRGVSERELQKAKNRVRASFVFGLESNLSRAMELAEYELYWDDASLLLSEPQRYEAVSRQDIQRVAKKYFATDNRTVLDVLPADKKAAGKEGKR